MKDTGTSATWIDETGPPGRLRSREDARASSEAVSDWVWIAFFFGIASPSSWLGLENPERYFWLTADLAVLIYIVRSPETMFCFVRQQSLLMYWCALAVLSALWSLAPGVSIYHGIQLLMTVLVGGMLCIERSLERILKILFAALLLSLVASIVLLAMNSAAAFDRNDAFRGILNHKNELGSRMALLLLTAVLLILHGWRRGLTFAAICAAGVTLVASRSGAALLLVMAWLIPLALAVSFQSGDRALSVSLGIASILTALLIAYIAATDLDIVSWAVGSIGKETTLSGRTMLWSIGEDAFMRRPLLGHGFKGYWENPDSSSVILLRFVTGQNLWFFHNNYLEVAVAFGVVGPILLLTSLAKGLAGATRRYAIDRSFITLWSAFYIMFVIAYGFVENPLFINHSVWQLLFVVALGARASPPLGQDRACNYR